MYKEYLGRFLWQKKVVWKEKIINLRWGKMRGSVWRKQKRKSHLFPFLLGADWGTWDVRGWGKIMLDGSVVRKEIILVGSQKRWRKHFWSESNSLRDTEAVEIICIFLLFYFLIFYRSFFLQMNTVPQKMSWEEKARHEFKEGDGRRCWRCRGRREKIGHKRDGKENLVFGVGREGSVLCYAVCKLPKNYKQCDLENKPKICLFLNSLSMILVSPVFCFCFKSYFAEYKKVLKCFINWSKIKPSKN